VLAGLPPAAARRARETRRPQGALCRDPVRDGIERPRIERQDVLTPARRRRTKPRALEDADVLETELSRDRERFRERSHRASPCARRRRMARRVGSASAVRALSSWHGQAAPRRRSLFIQ